MMTVMSMLLPKGCETPCQEHVYKKSVIVELR